MTNTELDIFRSIAKSLERIADHMTGTTVKEVRLSELCDSCAFRDFQDRCMERRNAINFYDNPEVCYEADLYSQIRRCE